MAHRKVPGGIERRYGQQSLPPRLQKAYYFDGAFSEAAVKVFLDKLHMAAPYRDVVELSENCELAVREKEDRKYLFVLNYSAKEQGVILKKPLWNLLTEEWEEGTCMIEKYGVRLYRL